MNRKKNERAGPAYEKLSRLSRGTPRRSIHYEGVAGSEMHTTF